jgi:hypothetical protein
MKATMAVMVLGAGLAASSGAWAEAHPVIDDFGPGILGLRITHIPSAAKILGDCERTDANVESCAYQVGNIEFTVEDGLLHRKRVLVAPRINRYPYGIVSSQSEAEIISALQAKYKVKLHRLIRDDNHSIYSTPIMRSTRCIMDCYTYLEFSKEGQLLTIGQELGFAGSSD